MGRVDVETPDGAAYFGPKPEFEYYVKRKLSAVCFPCGQIGVENESNADNNC